MRMPECPFRVLSLDGGEFKFGHTVLVFHPSPAGLADIDLSTALMAILFFQLTFVKGVELKNCHANSGYTN